MSFIFFWLEMEGSSSSTGTPAQEAEQLIFCQSLLLPHWPVQFTASQVLYVASQAYTLGIFFISGNLAWADWESQFSESDTDVIKQKASIGHYYCKVIHAYISVTNSPLWTQQHTLQDLVDGCLDVDLCKFLPYMTTCHLPLKKAKWF